MERVRMCLATTGTMVVALCLGVSARGGAQEEAPADNTSSYEVVELGDTRVMLAEHGTRLMVGADSNADCLRFLRSLDAVELAIFAQTRWLDDNNIGAILDLPKLQTLLLFQTGLTDRGFETIAKLPVLKVLSITDDAGLIGDEGLAFLEKIATLRILRLLCPNVSDTGMVVVGQMGTLEELSLVGTCVTDLGIAHLSRLTNLKFLHCYGSILLTDRSLDGILPLTRLRQLYCQKTRFSDAGLVRLAALENLEILSFDARLVSDAGMAALARMSHLEELDLSGGFPVSDKPHITNLGVMRLRALRRLWRLDLSGCSRVTDWSVPSLALMGSLQNLRLSGTGISALGKRALRAARPSLHIVD